ncbi:MAG: polyribonucleotide nucleotidyltransferase [Candidatus Azambacteria bacterium]|nr:polyribonucleotide nucleotidyltransferase [Candidatus Azambacteria bacterium]
METKEFSLTLGDKAIVVRKNLLAGQANGSVIVSCGDTVVLATAVISKHAKENIDYFPLSVEYEERFYAAGRIPGSRFIKRETRASQEAILTGRLIDRALRPLFDSAVRNEVQVIVTVLSIDHENDPDVLAMVAASAALATSNIPWAGPIGAVRIGRVDGTLILNPTYAEREKADMDLVVAGIHGRINMIEGDAAELEEGLLIEAITLAQTHVEKLIVFQNEIVKAIGIEKIVVPAKELDASFISFVESAVRTELEEILYQPHKQKRLDALNTLKEALVQKVALQYPDDARLGKESMNLFEELINTIIHDNIIHKEKRPDGRKADELRSLSSYVSFLPRTHGSGIFVRGETQVLSVLTLGSPGDQQIIDTMETKDGMKRFMHHYNFPPYSVGETKPLRGPSRRDIGHGALAERALVRLLPPQNDFPYTIRLVSETLSSNGSSSMASVCASTLALMDGGVPIKAMAAGIAMGLMSDAKGNYKVLTDIQGPEDHHGDMDLKVAGTENGITALQMDVKVDGVTPKILHEAFIQAKKARLEILSGMRLALAAPRPELSKHAPRIITLRINPDKIRDVIGPGGKMINEIINSTGVAIDIEDDGSVFITSVNQESAQKAVEWVKNLTREAKVGEIFQGIVKRIMAFGAFVEIFPGTEGLVHVSHLSDKYVGHPDEVVKIGDVIPVKLVEIDSQGRMNLSHKATLPEKPREEQKEQ